MNETPWKKWDLESLKSVDKAEIDVLWRLFSFIGEQERHFNDLQARYRAMASGWLLASFAGIGFVISESVHIGIARELLISGIAIAGAIGIYLLWVIDVLVYHRLLDACFVEGLKLEKSYDGAPPFRNNMMRMMQDQGVQSKVVGFYLVPVGLLTLVSGGWLVLWLRAEGHHYAALTCVAVFWALTSIIGYWMWVKTENTNKFTELLKSDSRQPPSKQANFLRKSAPLAVGTLICLAILLGLLWIALSDTADKVVKRNQNAAKGAPGVTSSLRAKRILSTMATERLPAQPNYSAPDGSLVRLLAGGKHGSMAHFELPAGQVSDAVAHRTVEELWYFLDGRGEMWRKSGASENVVKVFGGVSISIPVGVSGALVEPCGAKTSSRHWGGRVDGARPAVTDDDGHFRMLLTEAFIGIDLRVTAHGYPGAVADLLSPGENRHQISVRPGTNVKGRLLHHRQPQAGQPVAVVQVNRSRSDRVLIKAVVTTTDDDGRFEFTALPASEPYAIFSPVGPGVTGPVLPTTLFNAKVDKATRDLGELDLVPGLSLAGRLQMTDGTKIPEGIRLVLDRMPAWDLIEVPTDRDGAFHIENRPPETYEISLVADAAVLDEPRSTHQILGTRSFGLRLTNSCSDLTIPLRRLNGGAEPERRSGPSGRFTGNQTLSGVVVDRNNEPVAGVKITPRLRGGFVRGRTTVTKKDGSFTIKELPDESIELMFHNPRAYAYPAGITSSGAPGWFILYPGSIRPQQGQSDIRIVFDPELTTPPVNLE